MLLQLYECLAKYFDHSFASYSLLGELNDAYRIIAFHKIIYLSSPIANLCISTADLFASTDK